MIRPIDGNALLAQEKEWAKDGGFYTSIYNGFQKRIQDAPTLDYAPVQKIDGNTSDGYHTFNELYHHRALLFSVIVSQFKDIAWKSKQHHDGTMYDGMFIVGVNTLQGQATYHYDVEPYWNMFNCKELEKAPEWDGHTAEQAIERIASLRLMEPFKKVAPVRHGEWVGLEFDGYADGCPVYDLWECSKCKGEHKGESDTLTDYCPNCGVLMDGDSNNEL